MSTRKACQILPIQRHQHDREAAWQDRTTFRRAGIRQDMERLRQQKALAHGWTVDDAADFVSGVLSLTTYEYLSVCRRTNGARRAGFSSI